MKQFLCSAKISDVDHVSALLVKRQVDLNELMVFSEKDLNAFLTSYLRLDILSRNRFKKELNKIRRPTHAQQTQLETKQRKIILSKHEQQAIFALYERYDTASSLQQTIMEQIPHLHQQMTNCIQSIHREFDAINALVLNHKHELLAHVDTLADNKLSQFHAQHDTLKQYQSELNNAKQKRNALMNSATTSFKGSGMRLTILNTAIHSSNSLLHHVTAPEMRFDGVNEKYISLFCDRLKMNTFDTPCKPYIAVYRVGFRWCGVIFSMEHNTESTDTAQQFSEYEISWCAAPGEDMFSHHDVSKLHHVVDLDMFAKDKYSHKKHKRRKHKKVTHYDGESDSSSSESEQVHAFKRKTQTIKVKKTMKHICYVQIDDLTQFDWKSVSIEADNIGKDQNYCKHMIHNLKANRCYFVHVRGRNTFGWSPYSETLHLQTLKIKKEKQIDLEVVKCREYYQHSSDTYHPNKLLSSVSSSMYASPLLSARWGSRNKDPDWIIFRPKHHKKQYYLTKVSITARNDGQSPKTIGLQIGDERLSAMQKCRQSQCNFMQLMGAKHRKRNKSDRKWIKTKPSKMVMIQSASEQTFKISHKVELDGNFNYYKLLFYDSQGSSGQSSCKYVVCSFKLWGVEIK